MKFCLLDMEWILHSVTHNGCDYLQKFKLAKIPAWMRRKSPRPPPKLRSQWQMIAPGRRIVLLMAYGHWCMFPWFDSPVDGPAAWVALVGLKEFFNFKNEELMKLWIEVEKEIGTDVIILHYIHACMKPSKKNFFN